jgi:hypothetical protein
MVVRCLSALVGAWKGHGDLLDIPAASIAAGMPKNPPLQSLWAASQPPSSVDCGYSLTEQTLSVTHKIARYGKRHPGCDENQAD